MMNNPESQIPEEMLSAYLDGELTPTESQRVATALEQSEELRSLLEDLKRVRVELQSLPRHVLASDFATRISRVCTSATPEFSGPQTTPQATDNRAATNHSSQWKLIAGVAATAATILIALWAMDRPGNPVAVSDANESIDRQQALESAAPLADVMVGPDEDSTMLDAEADGEVGQLTGDGFGQDLDDPVSAESTRRFRSKSYALQRPSDQTANKPFDATLQVSLKDNRNLGDAPWFTDAGVDKSGADLESLGRKEVLEGRRDRLRRFDDSTGITALGIEVPEGAKLYILEGTHEEVASALQDLNAISTSIAVEDQGTDAEFSALLSDDESVTRTGKTAQRAENDPRNGLVESARGGIRRQSINRSRALSAAPSPEATLEEKSPQAPKLSLQPAASGQTSRATEVVPEFRTYQKQNQQPRLFRILLIVAHSSEQ